MTGYEIRVKDHLDPCWRQWFEGWSLTNLENGVVLFTKSDVDHSALHGVLNKIRDLNLTLISVRRIMPGTNTIEEIPIGSEPSIDRFEE